MTAVTIGNDFGIQERKSATVSTFPPSICHKVMEPDFWMLSFKPVSSSLSSFTCIKRILSSSSFSDTRVASSTYLKLLIFLPKSWFQLVSYSLAFHMMYSAKKLNKQSDSIQPCRTTFPVLKQSVVSCSVPTVASWPTYRFLRTQVTCSGIPVSLRICHSLLWSTQSL